MTNFKETIRADCTISACRPLPLSIKALAHRLSVQGVSLLLGICPPPGTLLVASIQSKANFPFHQSHLVYWLLRGQLLDPTRRQASEETNSGGTLLLNFQTLRLLENIFLLCKSPSLALLG